MSLSGGMMDLGWAHRVAGPVSETTARLVDGSADFSGSVASFVGALRAVLTHSERVHRWWCSAQFTALELTSTHCLLARLGGMRVLSFQERGNKSLGREDVMSLGPGSPPFIATASLLPDVHWKSAAGGGWVLEDETEAAERMAAAVREEQYELSGRVSLAVMTHPLWTEVQAPGGSVSLSHAELTQAMCGLVEQARSNHKNGMVAVVRGR